MVRRVTTMTMRGQASRVLAAIGLAATGLVAIGWAAPAAASKPAPKPPLPAIPEILIPEDAAPFLRTQAVGTQNYVCIVTGSGFSWKFIGPQATLFVGFAGVQPQVATHFLSPNPDEGGLARATWQGSLDSSRVWAKATQVVDDPAVIGAGNIPWLLLQRVGAKRGPTGGGVFAQATWIQRVRTAGGAAPSTGCSQSTDVGAVALVPYSTDYVFLR